MKFEFPRHLDLRGCMILMGITDEKEGSREWKFNFPSIKSALKIIQGMYL
jgi:hypothetical protein